MARGFESYGTLGGLFYRAGSETLEQNICQYIWLLLLALVAEVVEILEVNPGMLMEKLIPKNQRTTELKNIEPFRQAGQEAYES